jgi:hypothetical protein
MCTTSSPFLGTVVGSAAAAAAEADDREVGEARLDREPPLEERADGIELGCGDSGHPPAALAERVLVLLRTDELVEACPVAEMHVADEPDPFQRLEVAVHGGEVGGLKRPVESGRELLGTDGPVDREQRLEDEPAGTRQPQPVRPHHGERVGDVTCDVLVALGCDGHLEAGPFVEFGMRYGCCSPEPQLRFIRDTGAAPFPAPSLFVSNGPQDARDA